MVRNRDVPKMTRGRAALVGLIQRYLGGLLDPFVTLLEVHKLMYFMQEAGEPLRLQYKQHHYGPYAANLRHVFNEIEGHLISGYADGGDTPEKRLELVPGAVDDASGYLEAHPDTLARFERVVTLVDGFESPFGLELLSTVHWIMRQGDAKSEDDVIARVHGWNDRKKRFSPHQIVLAIKVLRQNDWVEK